MENIWCYDNNLVFLAITGCPNLRILHCENNQLTDLDLNSCSALEELACNSKQLVNLWIYELENLKELHCQDKQASGKVLIDEEIDLGTIRGSKTVFTWFDENDATVEPICFDGDIFAFTSDHEGKRIQCRKIDENFSKLTLKTNTVLLVKPKGIYIVSQPRDAFVKERPSVVFFVLADAWKCLHLTINYERPDFAISCLDYAENSKTCGFNLGKFYLSE